MSGQPAARLGDMHTCPMVDPGPKPHIGGPILPSCAATVLVGNMPAARIGDKLTCMGPPDTIAKGSATVFIGGKPASRLGDSTVHGGAIVAGCTTVLVGDGSAGRAIASLSELNGRMQASDLARAAYSNAKLEPPGPYVSDEEKLAQAGRGHQEKYVIRLTKTQYADDSKTIGPGKTYWTTTYNQIEHAGSDSKAICEAVGVDHDPTAEYTLLVIDTEAGQAEGMKTFIPTYDALGDFAANHLEERIAHPGLIPEVMNDDYAKTYANLKPRVSKDFDPNKGHDMQNFAKKQNLSFKEANHFKTRYQLDKKLGANEHYQGNGLTKNLASTPENPKLGVVETFTYDKNPQTLGTLEKQGVVKRIHLGK